MATCILASWNFSSDGSPAVFLGLSHEPVSGHVHLAEAMLDGSAPKMFPYGEPSLTGGSLS